MIPCLVLKGYNFFLKETSIVCNCEKLKVWLAQKELPAKLVHLIDSPDVSGQRRQRYHKGLQEDVGRRGRGIAEVIIDLGPHHVRHFTHRLRIGVVSVVLVEFIEEFWKPQPESIIPVESVIGCN